MELPGFIASYLVSAKEWESGPTDRVELAIGAD